MNDAALPTAGENGTAADAAAREPVLRVVNGSKIYGVHVNDWRDPRAFGDRHLPSIVGKRS